MAQPPLLTAPAGNQILTRWFRWTQEWTPSGQRWIIKQGNRIDVNRSELIEEAMKQGRALWQWDTDVFSQQSYEEMLRLIEEDTKRGWDAIVAATGNGEGNVNVMPLSDKSDPKPTIPFEIKGALCGCFFLSVHGLSLLKPIGYMKYISGQVSTIYCTTAIPSPDREQPTLAMSEDFDLAYRFRAQGGKICCDPRLQVIHMNKRDVAVRGGV